MNQHTVLQNDKTTTGCASLIELFFKTLYFSILTIFEGFEMRQGAWFRSDDEELFGFQESMVQVEHCILDFYCTVKLRWHAFHNQLLFSHGHFFPQSELLSIQQ